MVLLNNMYSVSAEEGWISDGGMQSLKYLNIEFSEHRQTLRGQFS